MTNHDDTIKYYEGLKTNKGNSDWMEGAISNLQKAKEKKTELIAENTGLRTYESYNKNLPDLQKKTWDTALRVSLALQQVYTDLYRKKSDKDKRPNPCKDFEI